MKKELYLPILGITAGELMMFSGFIYVGLAVHIINLQAIALALIFSKFPSEIKNIHQSLILLLQMRIIALAMPQFFTLTLLWYPFIYGVMYIPIYLIIKNQNIQPEDLGINLMRFKIYLPSAVLIGAGIAVMEYYILRPIALIENINISNLVLISLVMFVFIGAVEELIFRSILQTRFEKVLGLKYGVFISGSLFGIMHAGYGMVSEILFASISGFIIGYIFQRTRSFPFILTIHGTANVLLFGVLPILLA